MIPVDLHTHAPLDWLLPDYHEGVRPGAHVKLDFTFEEHWETLSPEVDRMVVLDIARGGENQNDAIAAYADAHPRRQSSRQNASKSLHWGVSLAHRLTLNAARPRC